MTMLRRLLLRWLGLATVDVERVAQALAATVLDDYAGMLEELEPAGTRQYLRTQYMRLVSRYGLPGEVCNPVADRAWAIIIATRGGTPDAATSDEFAFYD
jgi:hypothetical protein